MFSVVPLTLAISLTLVAMFVFFFWREASRKRFGSSETESLLPLAEETPNTKNDSAHSGQSHATQHVKSESAPMVLDLSGRVPRKRRGKCGRHGGESGGECGTCENRHTHGEGHECGHEHEHAHNHDHGADKH